MKRKDALWVMQMCRDRDARSEAEREAFDTAIEALKSESIFTADRPRDGDLISREEAIEAIELVDWYHQNSNKDMVHGANDDEHQAWYKAQDIYKAIETVPSADRPRGEWTPVSERFPEIDKRVIVTGTMWGMWEVDIDRWNGERWVKYGGYVLAWMPLPEPYKESGDK